MNSDYVKASVACYFRYQKQCPIICFERNIDNYMSTPDVLAIDKQRRLIEVEVKVSMSDLKNDAKKRIWKFREIIGDKSFYAVPYQFYYAVPYEIQDKALEIIKGWKKEGKECGKAGLLVVHQRSPKQIGLKDVHCEHRAPINKAAKKLTIKQTIIMARNQSGTLCSMAVHKARHSC